MLGIITVLGLTGVYFYEEDGALPSAPDFPQRLVREITQEIGLNQVPSYERDRPAPEPVQTVKGFGVSAVHPLAVEVGMDVLEDGGNAVDAAVAVSYALAVVEPYSSGPGGGGAMVLAGPDQKPVAYDYREVVPRSGEISFSKVGVPGFVRGMEQVHARHGNLKMAELIDPAIRLAEDGFEIDKAFFNQLLGGRWRLPYEQLKHFYPVYEPIDPGTLLKQPELAETLRTIRDGGAEAFYEGPIAEAIASQVEGMTPRDLARYKMRRLEPSTGTFRGHQVLSSPPPTAGPMVVQALQMLEARNLDRLQVGSAQYRHLIAQAYRHANAQRLNLIGDPAFADVDMDRLTSPRYTRRLASKIDPDGFAKVTEDTVFSLQERQETDTTQIVVFDADGMMVSMTNTISNFFGSGLYVDGFFLNDQLKNFSEDEDSPNLPAPGKRPRSFIAPTMVLTEGGEPVLGIGTPGGRRIPLMVVEVIADWLDRKVPLAEVVAAPRFHLEGHKLELEEEIPDEVVESLQRRDYTVEVFQEIPTYYGAIQALAVDYDKDELYGVADERRGGAWKVGTP